MNFRLVRESIGSRRHSSAHVCVRFASVKSCNAQAMCVCECVCGVCGRARDTYLEGGAHLAVELVLLLRHLDVVLGEVRDE